MERSGHFYFVLTCPRSFDEVAPPWADTCAQMERHVAGCTRCHATCESLKPDALEPAIRAAAIFGMARRPSVLLAREEAALP